MVRDLCSLESISGVGFKAVTVGGRTQLLMHFRPAGGGGQTVSSPYSGAAADAAAAHTSAADTLSLRLQEGVIAEIGSLCPKAGEQVVDLQGAYLSPGLVDAHVHLGLGGAVRQSALRCLRMGITALRNAGDALQQEEEEAMAEMSSDPSFPKVLTAGRALARGEGYGGFLGHSLRPNADLGQTVAEEIGRGADFIKVIVSGAVDFSRSAVEGPYFSESQLKEVVAVASSFGVPVAAHANGPKSIGAAVRAGVSTLEHGILIDDRGMEEMCAHGTAWVPTLTPLFNLSKSGRYPALQGLLDRHQQAVGRAVDRGIIVLPGTDAGSPRVPYGSLGLELSLLSQAGLSPNRLRDASTIRAAETIGIQGGYGCLEEGARTDLVWFQRDPFAGGDPSAPRGLVRAGRVYPTL